MQRSVVVKLCDRETGDTEKDAVGTVTFSVAGKQYETDLCQEHKDEVEAQLAEIVATSRPVRNNGGTRPRRQPASQADNDRRAAIRRWANDNGHAVGERGRISQAVIDAYDAANS